MDETETEKKNPGGRPSFKCSYAKQFLEERGISIFAGDKRILEPIGRTIYKTCKLKTGYYIGETFVEKRNVQNLVDYAKIKSLGYSIVSGSVQERTRAGQRVQYNLVWTGSAQNEVRDMPKEHYVEYDSYNRQARLRGPNTGVFSPWVGAPGKKQGKNEGRVKLYLEDYNSKPEAIIKKVTGEWMDLPEKPMFVPIKEVPFMISDSDEIVCLPKSGDTHTIGYFGQRGSGKTFGLLALLSRMYHKWNDNFVILNDWQAECGTWCMPNDPKLGGSQEQYIALRKINEIPLPLPCVYIYPHVKDHFEMINKNEVAYQTTLPYHEIITNFRKYMELNKTSTYFERLRAELLECSSSQDVEDLLKQKAEQKEIEVNSIKKIRAWVGNIFDNEITEKNTGISPEWTVKESDGTEYKYNPITACMLAGLIPVFETETLSSYEFFQPYFRYFVEDIFTRQIRDPYFKNKNLSVYFFIDELHTLSSTEQKGVVDIILKRVVREGRPRRMGVVVADQKFVKVPSDIKDNLKFVVCFVNPGEANEIAATYDLGKYWCNEIKNLDKFECLAWATDEPFVVYTRDGTMYKTKGPIRGKSLPPLSLHKKPKKSNGD